MTMFPRSLLRSLLPLFASAALASAAHPMLCCDYNGGKVCRVSAEGEALKRFTQTLLAFRDGHPVLRRERFLHGRATGPDGLKDITWFTPQGNEMTPENWQDHLARAVGVLLNGGAQPDDDLRDPAIDQVTLTRVVIEINRDEKTGDHQERRKKVTIENGNKRRAVTVRSVPKKKLEECQAEERECVSAQSHGANFKRGPKNRQSFNCPGDRDPV